MPESGRPTSGRNRNDVPQVRGFGRISLAIGVAAGLAMWLFARPAVTRRMSLPRYSEEPRSHTALPPADYERRDVSARAMAIGFGGVILALALSMGLAMWLYPNSVVDRRIGAPLPAWPAPRLQEDPARDMHRFYSAEKARLDSAGWVDRAHGIAHIPIDQAMKIVAQQGIPDWPGPKP